MRMPCRPSLGRDMEIRANGGRPKPYARQELCGVILPPKQPALVDVPTDYWSYEHVEQPAGEGVLSRYAHGCYRPTWQVTRDQMAAYVARAFGYL